MSYPPFIQTIDNSVFAIFAVEMIKNQNSREQHLKEELFSQLRV